MSTAIVNARRAADAAPVTFSLPKRYLSREEAARYTGLGHSTLNNLACAGKGPLYIKSFGRVMYDVADLDAWLQSMKVDPTTRVDAPAPAKKTNGRQPSRKGAAEK
jgi:predicted DNA-binding transcriptional regulator AlpA